MKIKTMEFKGTKGWKLQEDGTIIDESYNLVADFMVSDTIDLANAKVAEKSLEMLEMLDEIICSFEGDNLHGYQEEIIEQAKILIKQAREI